MSNTIEIPKSYLNYVKHHQAFAQIDGKNALPPSFSWDDIQAYYEARFSLEIIKYEYYIFMHTLWEETWGCDLKNKFEPCTVEDYTRLKANYSPEAVWKDVFVRLYKRREVYHWFAISANTGKKCINLYWYTHPDSGVNSSELDLGKNWQFKPNHHDWRVTEDRICEFNNNNVFDYSGLCDVAKETINYLLKLEANA